MIFHFHKTVTTGTNAEHKSQNGKVGETKKEKQNGSAAWSAAAVQVPKSNEWLKPVRFHMISQECDFWHSVL